MNFAFLLVGGGIDNRLAPIMIKSIRKTHANARIYQITDGATQKSPGVDGVTRSGQLLPLMTFGLEGLLCLPDEPLIVIDTDVVIQRNLDHVFDEPFDLGVTRRYRAVTIQGESKPHDTPYNGGILFSRNAATVRALYDACLEEPEAKQDWFGKEYAMKRIAEERRLKVKEFPGLEYNFSPDSKNENVDDKYVVHYKGKSRKHWMLEKMNA